MYQYDSIDQTLVDQRVAEYRDQTRRFLAGELPDDEFRSLRLRNGLYIQRFSPMLRIAVPYGHLSSKQLRMLGSVARRYSRGSGHFTTRLNLQLNWPKLEEVPDILADLASVQMHSIQTSGNCVRNVSSDPLAGVAADEIIDPRPYCEILRQWSTFHPEFNWLPRKFKIAVTGAPTDRAATEIHDIGLHLKRNAQGELGFEVLVGGGLGRTPILAKVIRDFLPVRDILTYCESILRVYNRAGRRDNIHKARIKILVKAMGIEAFREAVDADWHATREFGSQLSEAEIERARGYFQPPAYATLADIDATAGQGAEFRAWYRYNTAAHKVPGYRAVFISLKGPRDIPGDISSEQMEAVADLADRVSFGEIRVVLNQNLLLAHVRQDQLHTVWQELKALGLATPNLGTLTDMIACPGLDLCSLANAGTISVVKQIQQRFSDFDYLYDIGEIELKMSGCMNACGHHHVGHIGILGVDKHGEEWYQITIGGSAREHSALGEVIGPSVPQAEVAEILERILTVYRDLRQEEERFIDTVRRVGVAPFKERVYEKTAAAA